MACLKYADGETCAGYESNKLCAACDKNARLSPEEGVKNTMMITHKATCADKKDSNDKGFNPCFSGCASRMQRQGI